MATPHIAQKAPFPVDVTDRQKIFLVRVRQKREPTVLRRFAQGHGIHAGDVSGRKGSHGVLLRLQTHCRRPAVRWKPQQTLIGERRLVAALRFKAAALCCPDYSRVERDSMIRIPRSDARPCSPFQTRKQRTSRTTLRNWHAPTPISACAGPRWQAAGRKTPRTVPEQCGSDHRPCSRRGDRPRHRFRRTAAASRCAQRRDPNCPRRRKCVAPDRRCRLRPRTDPPCGRKPQPEGAGRGRRQIDEGSVAGRTRASVARQRQKRQSPRAQSPRRNQTRTRRTRQSVAPCRRTDSHASKHS